jgi:hypothetical protein
MSLYKLPPSVIIHSFSGSYAVMVNHFPSCICLMWQRRKKRCVVVVHGSSRSSSSSQW